MKRLKKLVQHLSGLIVMALQPISQSDYRKQYLNYQALVDNLLRAERGLTKGKERRRSEYEAVRTDAIILRTVIEQRPDAIKFDFLIEHLRGIALRCTLVVKNIELNTRSTKYAQVSHKRVSDFNSGLGKTHVYEPRDFPSTKRSDKVTGNRRSDNVVCIHRVGIKD